MLSSCGLIIVFAVLAYATYLGPSTDYTISRTDAAAWANFGTYFGGVLGPIFGFLAFIGLLFTLVLQAKQLDAAHKQAGLEEFQRTLSSCAVALDAILGRRLLEPLIGQVVAGASTVREVVSGGGHSAMSETTDYLALARRDKIVFSAKAAVNAEASDLMLELDHLVWCLKAYEDEGGRIKVLALYQRRYSHIVIFLDALGFITRGSNVDKYFEPQKHRHTLAP